MKSTTALYVLVCLLTASCSGRERKVSTTEDSTKRIAVAPAIDTVSAEPPLSPALWAALATRPDFEPWQRRDFYEQVRTSYRGDAQNGLWWVATDLNSDGITDVALSGRGPNASPMVVALLSQDSGFVARIIYHADARPGDKPISLRRATAREGELPTEGIALTIENPSWPTLMFWNGERFVVAEGP